jgi:hypothetical protein
MTHAACDLASTISVEAASRIWRLGFFFRTSAFGALLEDSRALWPLGLFYQGVNTSLSLNGRAGHRLKKSVKRRLWFSSLCLFL